jgi:hypothetical protein
VVLGYRRTTADYLPSERIVTHSQPPSETREPVPGHETTWSRVIESGFFGQRSARLGRRQSLTLDLEVLPLTPSRLSISLPDKYPGQLIQWESLGLSTRGRLDVAHEFGRARLGLGLTVGLSRGYLRRASYREQAMGLDVTLAFPP